MQKFVNRAVGVLAAGLGLCPLAAGAQSVRYAPIQGPQTYYSAQASSASAAPSINAYAPVHTGVASGFGSTLDNSVNVTSNINNASNINVQTNIDDTRTLNTSSNIQVTNSVDGISVDYGLSGANVFNSVSAADDFASTMNDEAKANAEAGVAEALAAAQLSSY